LINLQEHCECNARKRSLRERHEGGGQLDKLEEEETEEEEEHPEEEAQEEAQEEEQPEEEGQRSEHCILAFESSGK
jgi:hypothetical protein